MSNLEPKKTRKTSKPSIFMELDAWLDSTLYRVRNRLADIWESITIASRIFHVTGWKRGVTEVLSEGFTLGVAGSILMLLLALPAFQLTQGDWLRSDDIAVTFEDRFGNEIGKRGIIRRAPLEFNELPDHLIQSVLATEDRRFFEHYGIDFFGLARAMTENARAGSVVQGGSTITQQLAKNIFLSNERTLDRKINEAFLAVWLEFNLSKNEILQLYLDRAYMGGGTFGLTAAADFYFGKDARDLSLAQSAMLAGLFKAPAKYAPHVNLPAARARANEVLVNLVQGGFMLEGQIIPALRRPATVIDREDKQSPDYFLDWAFEEVRTLLKGTNIQTVTARTTIDLGIQEAAEESIEFHLRQFGERYDVDQAAVVVMENSGPVRAIVGGRDYGKSQFNRATRAKRPTGSSFKPYVFATAMENGFTEKSVMADRPFTWGQWSPKNYAGRFAGNVTLETALVRSINIIPAKLGRRLGIKKIIAKTHEMGVKSKIDTYPPMVLGTTGLTLIEQTNAYNVFSNGGFANQQYGISLITADDGTVLYDHNRDKPAPKRVLTEDATRSMNRILSQIPERGTGRRAAINGIKTAGKTGTTQDYRDAWFVGFTGNFTTAVWMGKDNYTPTDRLTGGSLPAMTFKRVMEYAHRGIELKPIPYLEQITTTPKPKNDEEDVFVSQNRRQRPLSPATMKKLLDIEKAFKQAPKLKPNETAFGAPNRTPDNAG